MADKQTKSQVPVKTCHRSPLVSQDFRWALQEGLERESGNQQWDPALPPTSSRLASLSPRGNWKLNLGTPDSGGTRGWQRAKAIQHLDRASDESSVKEEPSPFPLDPQPLPPKGRLYHSSEGTKSLRGRPTETDSCGSPNKPLHPPSLSVTQRSSS